MFSEATLFVRCTDTKISILAYLKFSQMLPYETSVFLHGTGGERDFSNYIYAAISYLPHAFTCLEIKYY